MHRKIVFLALGLLLLPIMILPVERARSQGLSFEAMRVITLSGIGQDRANAVAFSRDGSHLAVAASAGIYLFDPKSLAQEKFIPMDSWVRTLAFSTDGSTLAAGLYDDSLHVLDFPDMQPVRKFEQLGSWVRSVAYSPNGRLLVAAAGDSVHVWNTADNILKLTLDDLVGVRAIAISPNNAILAIGLENNTIELHNLSDGSLLKILNGHQGWIRCLSFSPDGKHLASGAFDATARIWDVRSGKLLFTLADHQSSVLAVAFSPDNTTLATGSVDQTVRLWSADNGALLRTFIGHNGFVYSIAFSPDGQILASGANDNTVRLWNLNAPEDTSLEPPVTPKDCRICHHPNNNSSPVAVVDVQCNACHPNGLGVNWCPFFPRSMNQISGMKIVTASHEKAGVPIPGRDLSVTIFAPSNGEVVYSNSAYVAPMQLTGKVESASLSPDQIELQLEIWEGTQLISSLSGKPKFNGQFSFNLGVNPAGHMLRINDPAAPFNCAYCHDDYFVQFRLPAGEMRLLVVATAFDGDRASDERWITTDISQTLPLEVTIKDAFTGKPVTGVTVQASTRLYEWRDRTSSATSQENGAATLLLEGLSNAPLTYEIHFPDQVVDGIFYSARETPQFTVDSAAVSLEPLILNINSKKGQIHGTLTYKPDTQITVWAIQLPAGPILESQTDTDGSFSFTDIPISQYMILADPIIMAKEGQIGEQIRINLEGSPASFLKLNSTSTDKIITETITGPKGEWIPFAWLLTPDGTPHPSDVGTGLLQLNNASDEVDTWTVVAPGYYSEKLSTLGDSKNITLKRQADSEWFAWGTGEYIIPVESKAQIIGQKVNFDSGWIWGTNLGNESLEIQTGEAEIRINSGQFALERPAGGMAWFYLFAGQAEVRILKTGQTLSLQPNQMMAFSKSDSYIPINYRPEITPALRPLASMPVSPKWEPGFAEKVGQLSIQTGVILAQLVTFITYLIAVISLVGIPLLMIRWLSGRLVFSEKKKHGK